MRYNATYEVKGGGAAPAGSGSGGGNGGNRWGNRSYRDPQRTHVKYGQQMRQRCWVDSRTGECHELTKSQMAYRGGYRDRGHDEAAKFMKLHPDYKRKTYGMH